MKNEPNILHVKSIDDLGLTSGLTVDEYSKITRLIESYNALKDGKYVLYWEQHENIMLETKEHYQFLTNSDIARELQEVKRLYHDALDGLKSIQSDLFWYRQLNWFQRIFRKP